MLRWASFYFSAIPRTYFWLHYIISCSFKSPILLKIIRISIMSSNYESNFNELKIFLIQVRYSKSTWFNSVKFIQSWVKFEKSLNKFYQTQISFKWIEFKTSRKQILFNILYLNLYWAICEYVINTLFSIINNFTCVPVSKFRWVVLKWICRNIWNRTM